MSVVRSADVEFTPGLVENTRRRILVSPDKGSGTIIFGEAIMNLGTEFPTHIQQD